MRRLFWSEAAGAVFVLAAGAVLHFAYGWSGDNRFVGLVAAVNESTWEHLKLLFFPFFLYSAVEYFWLGQHYKGYVAAKAAGVLTGMLAITTFFYTYTGVVGRNFLAVDLLVFALGIAAAFWVSWSLLRAPEQAWSQSAIIRIGGWALFLPLLAAFLAFTLFPPEIGLFHDPVTGEYGFLAAQ